MSGSNLTAGTWDITRTRGDIMVPDEFELEMNGSPWVVESVKAQVRVAENRFSDLVYNLPVNVVGNVVSVGQGLFLFRDAGNFFWDLQVVDSTFFGSNKPFTVLKGKFVVVEDVTL